MEIIQICACTIVNKIPMSYFTLVMAVSIRNSRTISASIASPYCGAYSSLLLIVIRTEFVIKLYCIRSEGKLKQIIFNFISRSSIYKSTGHYPTRVSICARLMLCTAVCMSKLHLHGELKYVCAAHRHVWKSGFPCCHL